MQARGSCESHLTGGVRGHGVAAQINLSDISRSALRSIVCGCNTTIFEGALNQHCYECSLSVINFKSQQPSSCSKQWLTGALERSLRGIQNRLGFVRTFQSHLFSNVLIAKLSHFSRLLRYQQQANLTQPIKRHYSLHW